jgi:hypothetical protein
MMASEFSVYEGVAGGAAVNECDGRDGLVIGGERTRDNKVFSIHGFFLDQNIINCETRERQTRQFLRQKRGAREGAIDVSPA